MLETLMCDDITPTLSVTCTLQESNASCDVMKLNQENIVSMNILEHLPFKANSRLLN